MKIARIDYEKCIKCKSLIKHNICPAKGFCERASMMDWAAVVEVTDKFRGVLGWIVLRLFFSFPKLVPYPTVYCDACGKCLDKCPEKAIMLKDRFAPLEKEAGEEESPWHRVEHKNMVKCCDKPSLWQAGWDVWEDGEETQYECYNCKTLVGSVSQYNAEKKVFENFWTWRDKEQTDEGSKS